MRSSKAAILVFITALAFSLWDFRAGQMFLAAMLAVYVVAELERDPRRLSLSRFRRKKTP